MKCSYDVDGVLVTTFSMNDVNCAVYSIGDFEVKITEKKGVWLKTVHYSDRSKMPPTSNSTLVFSQDDQGFIKNYVIKPDYLKYLSSL